MDTLLKPKRSRVPLLDRYFSFLNRRSPFDALIFNLVIAGVVGSLLYTLLMLNDTYVESVPSAGGTIVEGIIGTPRFVNPVLALTRADQDMVELVFSGLLKLDESGQLVPDVAQVVTRSDDGRTYDVVLRRGVRFHNGTELTARDVAFTISLIQDPDLKSPLRGSWDGVSVEVVDDYTLTINLREPYIPFIENLTVGILPRDLWSELPIEQVPFSQNNTEPVGSGPYRVTNVLRTPSGLISAYELTAFENAARTEPNITTLVFNFYQNEELLLEALRGRQISGTPSLSMEALKNLDTSSYRIIEEPLPRTFGIYFNQNRSIPMRDLAARTALSVAIDREALIDKVLSGYGIPTISPVPPGFLDVELQATTSDATTSSETNLEQARDILRTGGWTEVEGGGWQKTIAGDTVKLAIKLSTANTGIFDTTGNAIAEVWRSLGVEVTVAPFEQTDLVQNIIRPRDFEAVLYGADIGRSIDLYPFWHSSQKSDPGLNIAQYTNIDADELLEDIRNTNDDAVRLDAIRSFERLMKSEFPAIFLYTPTFGYVVDADVNVTPFTRISKPSERFANVHTWHVRSDDVWPVFSNEQ